MGQIRSKEGGDPPELVLTTDNTGSIDPYSGTNILFIAIDDMKPIAGCYGDPLAQTPNMDELASVGTVFLNNHCQWAVCGPSRASIMTSLMPEETGVMGFVKMRHNDDAQLHDLVTLPEHFKNNGYETAATGKINDNRCVGTINPDGTVNDDGNTYDDPPSWSVPYVKASSGSVSSSQAAWAHDPGTSVKRAAESVDAPDADFPDGQICIEGLGLLDSLAAGSKPFFLGVGFKKPHLPFLAPKPYWDLYQRDDFTVHPHQTGILNQTAYTFNNITELRDNYYMDTDGQGYALQLTGGQLPDDTQKELLHGYYASISFVDAQVGLLMDKLVELGLDTNTIVVLWGDHGFHLGDHNEWGKHTNLEQATRSPMIIYSPWKQGGQATQSPTGFLDIYPTLCALAGLPVPEQPLSESQPTGRPLRGKSLVPILDDPAASVRTGALSHYGSGTYGYAYRTERYRYIEWINGSGNMVGQELYDYDTDPMEKTNLAFEVTTQNLMYDLSILMRTPGECDGADRLAASAPMAVPTNSVPVFSADPLLKADATESAAYGGSIAADASDADGGQILSFSKVTGPAWLNVAADGTLSGTPSDLNTGTNSWTVQVDDGAGGVAAAQLHILVNYGALTAAEISAIETDLGITLSAAEKADLEAVVKPAVVAPWRIDANARIDQNRKAYLDIQVVDNLGSPIEGAQVSVQLRSHAFKWAGTLSVKDFNDVNGNLRISTDTYRQRILSMFNAVGLNNGFKPRLTNLHQYLPDFMGWAQTNSLAVRGHLLLWPGIGELADLDDTNAVIGVDYGTHLSSSSTSDYASYDVRTAVETYKTSARTQADKDALKAVVDAEIQEWSSRWGVYEWDVINETLGNYLLQEILGQDQMAEWFKVAQSNVVSPACKLLINDYQIISAMSEELTPGWYTDRRDRYMTNIDRIISDGGPLDGIGFQSRIKSERRDPSILWDRLKEFGDRYGLRMVGTEFEVVDSAPEDTWKTYTYTDLERGEITDEMMTQYFSHPLTTGFTAWNVLHDETSSLIDYDGQPKLNGLVWYYLHRIRYTTDETSSTDSGGWTSAHAFLGDYDIVVTHQGSDYPVETTLAGSKAVQIVLSASNSAPAFISNPVVEINALESTPYSATLADDATDADSDPLTFTAVAGPAWLNIALNGDLSGTPGTVDVGLNSWTAQVSDGNGGSDTATLEITVDALANQPPAWSTTPFTQLAATEDAAYTSWINWRASDPESDPLTFAKVSGPAWVSVASNGKLTGTPVQNDVGMGVFVVSVSDGINAAVEATMNLEVLNTNDAPAFAADPVATANATENAAYSDTLAGSASDEDSDPLAYSKLSGPAWLTVAANGDLSGTPGALDVGANSWSVQVEDGNGGSDTATLEITVDAAGGGGPTDDVAGADVVVSGTVGGSFADTQASDNVYESISEVESGGKPANRHSLLEHKWTVNVTGGNSVILYVEAYKTANSEGDDFVFAWSSDDVNYTDTVTITKTADDDTAQSYSLPNTLSGTVYIRVRDTDRTAGRKGLDTVYIDQVYIRSDGAAPPNAAPAFSSDPVVEINATENAAYSASLADNASDPENDPLSFSKVSGPAWLSVAADGSLSGTPGAGDVGLNSFTVQVDATGGSDTAVLQITVDAAGSVAEIFIADITMSSGSYGGNRVSGIATITIRDEFGAVVPNATVSVDWTGATTESMSGATDGGGVVVLESSRVKNGGTYTVTAGDVSASGFNYNPALNVETTDSVTAP
jgi:arylsulfatase A-like enzyme/GH35 family endo-1,4-beta-xylanase